MACININPSIDITFPTYLIYADMMENPVNSDWAVNSLAPAATDSNDPSITVRLFDDSSDEGVGFTFEIPNGASDITFSIVSRAETAPASDSKVALDLYYREIPDNDSVSSWSSAYSLTEIDIPDNEYFQNDSETLLLSDLNINEGSTYQFELVRDTDDADDDLAGDWALLGIKVSFN